MSDVESITMRDYGYLPVSFFEERCDSYVNQQGQYGYYSRENKKVDPPGIVSGVTYPGAYLLNYKLNV